MNVVLRGADALRVLVLFLLVAARAASTAPGAVVPSFSLAQFYGSPKERAALVEQVRQ